MLLNSFLFVLITCIIMAILLAMQFHPIIAGAITMFIMTTGFMIISIMRSKKRLSLLDDDCDPEAFIQRTEKQRAIVGKKPKLQSYLDIDVAAGLICMGRFEEAKKLLLSINKNRLSCKNDSLLVYSINLMLCFYELGDIECGEEIYETQVSGIKPINNRIVLCKKILEAERLFIQGKYDESRERYSKFLDQKLPKRTRIGIIYNLARIDEKTGNENAAMEKYKQVANEGNKLWVAQKAREKVGA